MAETGRELKDGFDIAEFQQHIYELVGGRPEDYSAWVRLYDNPSFDLSTRRDSYLMACAMGILANGLWPK